MTVRIAVLGTGANGAGIAADLVRAGHDVTLIEQWPAHVEAMRASGIRVEMPDRVEVTPVTVLHLAEVAEQRRPFDVVFLLVKAYDTRWAAELIRPLLSDTGVLVGLQNGMTVDDIAEIVGTHRTLGAVVEVSSFMFQPGIVGRHTPPEDSWFALGATDPVGGGHVRRVAGILAAAGRVDVTDDIRSSKWMKLVINATELVPSALLDLPVPAAAQVAAMYPLMLRAGFEAMDTARRCGAQVVPILGQDDIDTSDPHRYVEHLMVPLLRDFHRPDTKSTVLQDWMRGRRSEVDQLNGLVVQEHRAAGLCAPVNEAVVGLAREIELGTRVRGLHNLAELHARVGRFAASES